MRHFSVLLISVLTMLCCMAGPAATQDKTYNKPRFRDNRLDWCLTWGANCGKPAADAFCTRYRFTGAKDFRAEKVGTSATTQLFGSDQTCVNHDYCTAFAYITCSGEIPSERVFVNPVWKNRRLDVCVTWSTNCGKPAADAFCKANGFSESFEFVVDATPSGAPTRLIGTDQICDDSKADKPFCTGFQQIICK